MPRSWSASRPFRKKSGGWRRICCSIRRRWTRRTKRCAPRPRTGAQQTAEQKAAINQFHIAAIAEHFRKAGARVKQRAEDLPLDQRLANYIIEGTKDGLIADLDRKRAEGATPLEIINGPLMAGMAEVGRLFNNNELIVAEVLQSAEAMKAAVNHLEQFMEKADTAARGKVMLATVKGDVHDIGKNLVEIILANNGYTVVNLGIKVPPDVLIRAYQEHQPDAIGLSGLLVKSTQQMVITAADLKMAGILVPLLVGGAALSEKFTRTKIAPAYGEAVCYAKDAMTGLSLMNRLMDPAEREACWRPTVRWKRRWRWKRASRAGPVTTRRSAKVRTDLPIPPAPYLDRRVRDVPHLAGGVELHQSVHALRPASGVQGQFRKGAGGARSQGAGAVPQRGRGEAGGGALHEGEGGVAVLRSRARRQRDPPVRARRAMRPFTPSTSAGSGARTACA